MRSACVCTQGWLLRSFIRGSYIRYQWVTGCMISSYTGLRLVGIEIIGKGREGVGKVGLHDSGRGLRLVLVVWLQGIV